MAFRIHDSIVRGEIDNRIKGIVRGQIWFIGLDKPVVLKLRGNARPDLAGCLLNFSNPLQPVAHPEIKSLHVWQSGLIGDLTASRKVRVFDMPLNHALEMLKRGETPREHLANCLYLEWFSHRNGRVVIESAGYRLSISSPEWRLTAAEESQRAKEAAASLAQFLRRLMGHDGPES